MFARRSTQKNGNGSGNGNGSHDADAQGDFLIHCRNLVKAYKSPAGEFQALRGVELEVGTGEFVAVIGKSGSGKSTLVNMITGIDRPSGGEVLVGGVSVGKLSEGKLAQWRGRNVGVIFQFFQLLPTLTCAENVMLPMDFCGMYSGRERRERALFLLGQVGVAEQADKLPSSLSGGQQQRVAIARALANDPPILAADEPTGNLDSKTADSVFRLFESLVEQGKTILMVTHDRDLARRATRTIMLSDGEIIEEFLAKTFPALDEQQLIHATRDLDRVAYRPGEVILHEGGQPDSFYVITRGQVEVVVNTSSRDRLVVARMGRGQYFGEIELLRGGNNIATIRADVEEGAEVATLDREGFGALMATSEETRAVVAQMAQARVGENTAARRSPALVGGRNV